MNLFVIIIKIISSTIQILCNDVYTIFCSPHSNFKIDILSQIIVTGVEDLANFLVMQMRGLGIISRRIGSLAILVIVKTN